MKERPILFSGAMVCAILDGRKTQTRRLLPAVFNSPPELVTAFAPPGLWRTPNSSADPAATWGVSFAGQYPTALRCPYGAPGDRLWVRETWAAGLCSEGLSPKCLSPQFYNGPRSDNGGLWYAADDAKPAHPVTARGKWRPSIHMPRWASRLILAVESVRVERLQAITEEDARAEGVEPLFGSYVAGFAALWTQINGTRPGADWNDCNPWVWVVGFKRVAQ